MNIYTKITGFGYQLPARLVENAELEASLQLEKGWIERRTGIQSRYWVNENEHLIDLATSAGTKALHQTGINRNEIGLSILATSTPDQLLPPTAPLLAEQLGLNRCMAFDLAGACCGFIQALIMADAFVRTQRQSALIVAANILSRRLNPDDANCTVLFADAAGAIVLSPCEESKGILGMSYLTDGTKHDAIEIQAGGSRQSYSPELPKKAYTMQLNRGSIIFAEAVAMMSHCANDALKQAKLTVNEVNYFIPHQANARMTEQVIHRLNISQSITLSTLSNCGNSSAAGIPLTMAMAQQDNRFHAGDVILLAAAGAGMSGAAVVIKL